MPANLPVYLCGNCAKFSFETIRKFIAFANGRRLTEIQWQFSLVFLTPKLAGFFVSLKKDMADGCSHVAAFGVGFFFTYI